MRHHQRVVVNREIRIIHSRAHLIGVPETFVLGTPISDRGVPLPLAERVSEADIAKADYLDGHRFDDRDPMTRGVHHCLPQSRAGQRFTFVLVVGDQSGRRGLGAGEDGRYQPVAQGAGETELSDGQLARLHAIQGIGHGVSLPG